MTEQKHYTAEQIDQALYELYDLSVSEPEAFELGSFELVGEDENGCEGSWECEVTDLARRSHDVIKQLQSALIEITSENLELRKAFCGSKPFFAFDDQGVFEEFETLKERDAYASDAIQGCLHDSWDEAVTNIVAGIITARTEQTNVKQRPDNLDENGCDEDGHCWDESWSHTCDYELIPIQPQVASANPESAHG